LETQPAAEQLLSSTWGEEVKLEAGESLGGSNRSHVLRYKFAKAPSNAPETVVVKHAVASGGETYDPDATQGAAWRLFNDWAGLQFLTQCFGASEDMPTPRFIAGDRENGLIVLHDLGVGKGLDHYLLNEGPGVAADAVVKLFRVLGQMHAATCGKLDEYDALRLALGPHPRQPLSEHITWHRENQPKGLALLGITPPAGYLEEVEEFITELRGPGPFSVYSHTDPCPDNTLLIDGQVKLLDFEFSDMGNAAIDMRYPWALWPTCWCVNQLPEAIKRKAVTVYREELIKGCPAATDDRLFTKQLAAGCADTAIPRLAQGHVIWCLDKTAKLGHFTYLQQMLARLDGFAQVSEEYGHFPMMGEMSRVASKAIRLRLPSDFVELPLYPAFRS
jgi:hypothetical protein